MTGLMVGGAVARSRQNKQAQAQMQNDVAQANQRAADAEMSAALAAKDAEHAAADAAAAQAQAPAPATAAAMASPAMVNVTVTIPAGVGAGMPFNISHNGQTFSVACPQGSFAGQPLTVQLPAPQPAVAVAAAAPAPVAAAPAYAAAASAPAAAPVTMQKHTSSGKEIFREAMLEASAPPPPATGSEDLMVTADHLVDENSAQMKQFGIISVSKGMMVTLVEGDLVNGLGGSYKDYIKVVVPSQGGRFGMISRLVVGPAAAPPAIAPPPPPAIGM